MSLALLVYSISILPKLTILLAWSLISIVCTIFGYWGYAYLFNEKTYCDTKNETQAKDALRSSYRKFSVRAIIVSIIISLGLVFLPSEKTAYTMVAAYMAQKVVEDPKVQQLSGKVLQIVEQKLDSYIEEGVETAEKAASTAAGAAK